MPAALPLSGLQGKMLRLLLFSACLGALDARQMHITLKPTQVAASLTEPVSKEGAPSFQSQLLTNTKAKEVGTPFELLAGQNVSGVLSKDSIDLAGVTIEGVVFGETENMWNKWLAIHPPDGVLGLGLRGLAPEGVRPILDIMAEQDLISERVFGLWLGKDPEGGELTLGGLNKALYQGELTWASLTTPAGQWWAVTADTVTLGELDLCSGGSCTVMPEASTPYFLVSAARGKAINDELGGLDIGLPGVAGLDCTTLYTLPNLKIRIGGRTMEMGPLEYTFVLKLDGGLQKCISGFIGWPYVDDDITMVGTLFMQKFYVAYDRENDRIGFADSA